MVNSGETRLLRRGLLSNGCVRTLSGDAGVSPPENFENDVWRILTIRNINLEFMIEPPLRDCYCWMCNFSSFPDPSTCKCRSSDANTL